MQRVLHACAVARLRTCVTNVARAANRAVRAASSLMVDNTGTRQEQHASSS